MGTIKTESPGGLDISTLQEVAEPSITAAWVCTWTAPQSLQHLFGASTYESPASWTVPKPSGWRCNPCPARSLQQTADEMHTLWKWQWPSQVPGTGSPDKEDWRPT